MRTIKETKSVFLAGLLVLAAASGVLWTTLSLAQPRQSETVVATYVRGVLHVSIPWDARRSGQGKLTVEVLDPEDNPVGRVERNVFVGPRSDFGDSTVSFASHLPVEDLVWHRLRYRFVYDNEQTAALEGITSISRVLRGPVVHVFGQQNYLSGSPAAVRLIVTEKDSQEPVSAGNLQIQLVSQNAQPRTLYTGKLNERGTTRADFRFPAGLSGKYSLRYLVDTAEGETENTQEIRLEQKAGILLTTEKPVYQPGQTIHARALALDRADHESVANRKLTFEVEDSRGNKVFRKIAQTDAYGVASAEFGLADEVNFGTYHLSAALDGDTGDSKIALQVERYVLPKFKVDVDLGGKNEKPKRGYRPGDHVTGAVRANYFFGKAVDRAEVEIKASSRDVTQFDVGEMKGVTDGDGAFQFDIRLPNFFAGHPLQQGAALVVLEATVKDGSGHSESHVQTVTVSEAPLLIKAIPESGSLVPGLDNQVFLVVSYADGTPTQADLRIRAGNLPERAVKTDVGGIATTEVPGNSGITELRVEARDGEGNRASAKVPLDWRGGSDQILVRTDQALYRPGDRIRLKLMTTKEHGSAYVDVVKDGQTISTHDVDIAGGQATLDLTATPSMAGTVELNAYLFGHDARAVADHRLVFVQPADELRIETSVDQPVYKPGGEAHIGFHVTNRKGEGVQAALGVEAVDQAVFALAEKQPGFAKAFFYLEREVMKPRYEIHSVDLPEVITSSEPSGALAQRERAAQALFAATETVERNNTNVEFGREAPRGKLQVYVARYAKRMTSELTSLDQEPEPACNRAAVVDLLSRRHMVDAWGNPFRVDSPTWNVQSLAVRSAGPDGRFDTNDDIVQSVRDHGCPRLGFGSSGSLDVVIQHDRDTQNGMAAIVGTVADVSGGVIPRTSVQLVEVASGRVHQVASDWQGEFRIASLPPGEYRIEATASGFRKAVRTNVALENRDVALVTVTLAVGMVADSITVMAEAPLLQAQSGAIAGAVRQRAMATLPLMAKKVDLASDARPSAAQPASEDTHVRSWFPESLFIAPEIITDAKGRASVTIPIADNITTWRLAMLASTKQGALGTGSASLKVFQDFFTEMDLPVTLTQGDQVSIPVAIYNYAGARGDVQLRLDGDDWFSLDADTAAKTVSVDAGRVGASQFTIAAKRIGKFKLTLRAEMIGGAKRADIVVREIEVVPNGREQSVVYNGRLDSAARQTVAFPAESIPEASTVFVRLYPGPLSQVIEGMESLLRMPGGCFEQTSSSTYPNVLALDYMKRTKKATPEVTAKAEAYIVNGYQRLLTFEVQGGGFSWFGNAPANKILTAYGLMEFGDMAKVHDVDARVIQRTQEWLASQQQPDGSWRPDTSFINEGATNRFNKDILRITAYIAWALEVTGYKGPAVDNARRYIGSHLDASTKTDPYTLAVLANFAVDYGKDTALIESTMRLLLDARAEGKDQTWWNSEETGMYATGRSAAVETTGLAAQALLKQGANPAIVTKAMNYIVAKKDATGTWGTTQATIMALRALLLAAEKRSGTAKGTVEITLNGKTAAHVELTPENNDLLHQFAFKGGDVRSENPVEIRFTGEGSLAYQIAGRYFTPWTEKPVNEPLAIDVRYDRTRLEQDQIATATATVRNNLAKPANMVMIDLGIPPGFELLTEDLDSYRAKTASQKSGRLEKYSLTGTQAILYFDSIGANGRVNLSFRLRAKYPVRASTFASKVYEYYAPEIAAVARPIGLEVRKK